MTDFMINGLTKNVSYVVHAVLETKIEAGWLMDELIKCIKCLHLKGLHVKLSVCDIHPNNVSAYRKLIALYEKDEEGLRIYIADKLIYLFYDAAHLIKNIRNNLFDQKRLIFHPLSSNHQGYKAVEVKRGEISCSLLHIVGEKIGEKDMECQANLRPVPKLQTNVVQPGNCKQNVRVDLAIFDPSAAQQSNITFPTVQILPSF